MRLKRRILAVACAVTLMCSTLAHAEISKQREYEVIVVVGDDGKTVTVEEIYPEDEANFDPEGTIIKDVIFDIPDTEDDEVTVKISIPEGTTEYEAYIEDGGWRKIKVKVHKDYIVIPVKRRKRVIITVPPTGKSPKTGEPTEEVR